MTYFQSTCVGLLTEDTYSNC